MYTKWTIEELEEKFFLCLRVLSLNQAWRKNQEKILFPFPTVAAQSAQGQKSSSQNVRKGGVMINHAQSNGFSTQKAHFMETGSPLDDYEMVKKSKL